MKKLLAILLFFATVLPAVGQTDSVSNKPVFKNQVDLDVEFLALSISYKKRIAQNFSIGLNVGGIVAFRSVYNYNDKSFHTTQEIFHLELNLIYHVQHFLQTEIGFKYANLIGYDAVEKASGMNLGLFFGKNTITQFGFKSMLGYVDNTFIISNSFLVIKTHIKQW